MNILTLKDPLSVFTIVPDIHGETTIDHKQHFYKNVFYECTDDCPFCKIYQADWKKNIELKPRKQHLLSAYNVEKKEDCIVAVGEVVFNQIIEVFEPNKEIVVIREIGLGGFPKYTVKTRRKLKNIPTSTNDLSEINFPKREVPINELALILLSF